MGVSSSSSSYHPLGACGQGAVPRGPGSPIVVSVVRSKHWGLGDEEDVWQVEVPPVATVADLKAKIEELYDVPQPMQKLCSSDDPTAANLAESMKLDRLGRSRVYLLPEEAEEQQATSEIAGLILGGMQEAMETAAAVEQSLEGVQYKIYFERPVDAGGRAAGKKILIAFEALSLVGDVQQIVEAELFGAVDTEPAFFIYDGKLMPPHLTLYHCGIGEDRKVITVANERPPPTEEEQMLMQMLAQAQAEGGSSSSGAAIFGGGQGLHALPDRID